MREYIFALEFISRVLTEAPNQELLRHMIQEPMAEHWPVSVDDEKENQGLELIQNFTRGEVTDLHKQLVQDYFTLFEMSPPRCYVHESVWLSNDQLLYDEQTFAVRACYAKYGLQAHNSDRGPDDHLGLELSFLAYLLNAYEERREEQVELQKDIQHFFQEHLLKWAPGVWKKFHRRPRPIFTEGWGCLAQACFYGCKNF